MQAVAKVVVFIILTLGIYLFFSGHNEPGGGFIGGLVLASALVLLFLSFDIESVKKGIPVDFKKVAALGTLLAVGSGLGALFFDAPFLTQAFSYFDLPILGETELATMMIFEAGVALAVVGVVGTIILSISEDV
nr:Na(+)/H(+) antiporter subunit B [Virgibacillus natechei]